MNSFWLAGGKVKGLQVLTAIYWVHPWRFCVPEVLYEQSMETTKDDDDKSWQGWATPGTICKLWDARVLAVIDTDHETLLMTHARLMVWRVLETRR